MMNTEKRSTQMLAAYRVDRGSGGFRAIPMTEKEVDDRNFFIRLRLRGKSAWKLSNEQIEQVRLYLMGDIWIIEDENLRTFVLGKEEKMIAPVQETDAGKFKPEEKKEPQNTVEQEIKEPAEQEIKEVGEVWEEERQMEVEDYPEILPEGYTPASYIKCHDGSEVEEKEWRKAKELIGGLYEDIAREDWNLGEVYQKAKKLLAILEKLKKEEGKEGGPLCR